MSGEKYVQVTERQMSKMMSACREVDQQKAVQARLKQELGQAEQEIRRRSREAHDRYARYEAGLAGMSTEMRNLDQSQTRRLREQRERFDTELAGLGQRMSAQHSEVLELIDNQSEEFFAALDDQRQALQGQISTLATGIQRKETHETDQARHWLNDTSVLINEIDKSYRHRDFTPGEVDKLRSELQMAQGNQDQHLHQAAVASAQQTLLRALELRLKLERLEAEWDAHQAAALISCRETLAYCDTLTTLRLTLETVDGVDELDAEIDYWSEGALGKLLAEVKQGVEMVNSAKTGTVTLDKLKQAIADSAKWRDTAYHLVQKARETLVLSQLRHDIAATVEATLAASGWKATDSAYEGETVDGKGWRNAYHLKLTNLSGDEVVTIIAPDTQGVPGTNRVTLSYFGRSNDERTNLRLAKEVGSALAESGLEVGAPASVQGYEHRREGNRERLNFERVRQIQPATLKG
jgi:hypothetical protein